MPPKKTPTSSLSTLQLLVKRILYRSRAKILGTRSNGAHPWTTTTRPSPAMRVPQEIVEVIVAHLIYDSRTLRSCSLTCYSWYMASVHYLYPTLNIFTHNSLSRKHRWPNPILYMHTFGLLPFVETLLISDYSSKFSSKLFSRRILRQFSALANVRTLKIDGLDIPSFMPKFQRYFGPFLPTVRSLQLGMPKGSNRQIIFFVGLFQHLDDLSLVHRRSDKGNPEEDLTLIPSFIPPLQGRLVVAYWRKAGLFQEMVRLFGGIRFRAMDLLSVVETQLLLHACAKTLEVLRLYPDDHFAMTSLQDFDLSRNKSLRTLEAPAWAVNSVLRIDLGRASMLFNHALSTIRSLAFSQVKVIYWTSTTSGDLDQSECCREQFTLFREVHKVRDFQLVLHADVWERDLEHTVLGLKAAIEAEKKRGGFDDLFPEPLVTYAPLSNSQIDS